MNIGLTGLDHANNVANYIKKGRDNAISIQALKIKTGLTDRQIRAAIEILRYENCIINMQDGKGYYLADNRAEAEHYLNQERARANSIYRRLKGTRKFLKEIEGQTKL